MLAEQDERAASLIHPNNTKKIIRALERLKKGEESVRQFSDIRTETSDYDVILIGLTRNRDQLYDRINKRVDALWSRDCSRRCKSWQPWDSPPITFP